MDVEKFSAEFEQQLWNLKEDSKLLLYFASDCVAHILPNLYHLGIDLSGLRKFRIWIENLEDEFLDMDLDELRKSSTPKLKEINRNHKLKNQILAYKALLEDRWSFPIYSALYSSMYASQIEEDLKELQWQSERLQYWIKIKEMTTRYYLVYDVESPLFKLI